MIDPEPARDEPLTIDLPDGQKVHFTGLPPQATVELTIWSPETALAAVRMIVVTGPDSGLDSLPAPDPAPDPAPEPEPAPDPAPESAGPLSATAEPSGRRRGPGLFLAVLALVVVIGVGVWSFVAGPLSFALPESGQDVGLDRPANSVMILREVDEPEIGSRTVIELPDGRVVVGTVAEWNSESVTVTAGRQRWTVDRNAARGEVVFAVPVLGRLF